MEEESETYLRHDPTLETLEENLIVQCIHVFSGEKKLSLLAQREGHAIYLHRFSVSSFFRGAAAQQCRELWMQLVVPDTVQVSVREGFRSLLREMCPTREVNVPVETDLRRASMIVNNPTFGTVEESIVVTCIRMASGQDVLQTKESIALFLYHLSTSAFFKKNIKMKCTDLWMSEVVSDKKINKSEIQEIFKQMLRFMGP